MLMLNKITSLALMLSAILLNGGAASALPCKGKMVDIGDSTTAVSEKCGEAMLKEKSAVKTEEISVSGEKKAAITTIDEWLYDFGPEEQMQSYRFENGKPVNISSPGYGRKWDDMADNSQNGENLAVGDSYIEAYLKCGEPISKEKLPDKATQTVEGNKTIISTEPVVEWTYRYGPDAPGYTLLIENGQVTEIRTRAFGE
jgi:hypothetical protein